MEAAGLCDLGFAGYPLLPQRWIEWIAWAFVRVAEITGLI